MEVLKWKTNQIKAKYAERILYPELSSGFEGTKKNQEELIFVSYPIYQAYQKQCLVILEFKSSTSHIAKARTQCNEKVFYFLLKIKWYKFFHQKQELQF